MRLEAPVLASMLLAGCGTMSEADRDRVRTDIAERAGAQVSWPASRQQEEDRRSAVTAALASPLSPDQAVAIALANHPRVESILEGLGLAQADYLQAVLTAPVSLGAIRLDPDDDGEGSSLTYHAGVDLGGLLGLPVRIGAARAEREAARAEASRDVLLLAGAARMRMIEHIAARQVEGLLAQAADAADAGADAADALLAAGNIAQVDRDRERLFAEEMQLRLDLARAETLATREAVNAALGVSGESAAAWTSVPRLPAPPADAPAPGDVETRVIAANLDLAAAVGALSAARTRNGAAWISSLVPDLTLEGEREREEGEWKSGLGLSLLAPIFDLGGGERLRLASRVRQRAALSQALEAELRAQARAAQVKTEAARQAALQRRNVVLPLADAVFEGALLDFNAMEISLMQLLEARRQRIEVGVAAVESVRDYWLAQASLDLMLAGAVGGVMGETRTGGAAPQRSPGH